MTTVATGQRVLDVVVFGATAFVLRLVAGYLARHTSDGGRSGGLCRRHRSAGRRRRELRLAALGASTGSRYGQPRAGDERH
jgi:short subunit dehydrogenase-like uncharacterized protein